ncbi:unnamed protein product [Cuscuta campestris]|uniref:Uncharacterized protein n=1 Tax=Cuscuta campestris TaxID=132261 RepID=A0A484KR79_9ASTE|nr:unnamed protein product [Cuscuta campestris]
MAGGLSFSEENHKEISDDSWEIMGDKGVGFIGLILGHSWKGTGLGIIYGYFGVMALGYCEGKHGQEVGSRGWRWVMVLALCRCCVGIVRFIWAGNERKEERVLLVY